MSMLVKYLAVLGLATIGLTEAVENSWWKTASFYQIYPRSFKDSDGNGVGDLVGITEQLPYLKEIGITATWLSPIFKSPMIDFGYDIANFTDVDPLFGTMEDLEELIKRAKDVGVKIILDMVPNHTSDECEWFIKSAAGDPAYKDFYVWHPGFTKDGVRHPPTNWISVFRGPPWTWHSERGAYYLHQFHYKQPDLNYRNPKVRETILDVLRFWLRKGVAGFRVDAVPHIFEIAPDANGNWPDEPRNEAVSDPEDHEYLQHIYTTNQPETTELMYDFRAVLEEMDNELGGDERIIMTEAYAPLDVLMQYYGNDTADGAHIPFNFELIMYIQNDSNAHHYEESINNWLSRMPEGRTANWVLGNHDRSRIGSRFGVDRIDMMNVLLLTLPGCSVTYNGEEIGMTDVWISWNDTVDPQGCLSNPQEYERLSRDPCRTPFQWNEKRLAGFTTGETTWLPVSENYKLINVKRQRGTSMSHLNIFKQLQELRAHNTMRRGDAEVKALNDNVLGIKRSLYGDKTYIILLNIMNQPERLDMHSHFADLTSEMEYVLVTPNSIRRKGDKTRTNSIVLMPKESVVLRTLS